MFINLRTLGAVGLVTLCLGLLPVQSRADGVLGSSITGALYFTGNPNNYFDPANGYVPSGYLNDSGTTVTVESPEPEFGFADNSNTDLANFSATQFTIEDVLSSTAGGSDNPFMMTFVDSAFTGLTLQQATDSFPDGGLVVTLIGDEIIASWAGGPVEPNDDFTSTSTYEFVPEPSTWTSLAFGAGVLVLALRRKQRAVS